MWEAWDSIPGEQITSPRWSRPLSPCLTGEYLRGTHGKAHNGKSDGIVNHKSYICHPIFACIFHISESYFSHLFTMYSTEDTPDKLLKSLPASRCGLLRWCLSSHCSCKLESAWFFSRRSIFWRIAWVSCTWASLRGNEARTYHFYSIFCIFSVKSGHLSGIERS